MTVTDFALGFLRIFMLPLILIAFVVVVSAVVSLIALLRGGRR